MSKGSGRRPASVSDAELAARWEKAFGKKTEMTTSEFIEQVLGVKPEPYQKGIIDAVQGGFNQVRESVIKSSIADSETPQVVGPPRFERGTVGL